MKLSESPLKDKVILVADDEPDILETVEEALNMCLIHKAADYDTAFEYLLSYTYDIVILDIMGINGLELLKQSVSRGFPTVMLTAHAFSPEFLKKSIKLGAVCFLPKEELSNLRSFLEDVIRVGGRPVWQKLFDKLGHCFDKQFGPDWKEKDKFLKEFKEELLRDTNPPDTRLSSF
jgi:CheY-like chemotaxis protein